MLRFLTAGESHGKCLTGIVEGIPSGLIIDVDFVNGQLQRRQHGFGRGRRMKIEADRIEITSGVRHGRTLGGPISFILENKDWQNWQIPMSTEPVAEGVDIRAVTRPRPGHADLAGALKYQTHDARDVIERASARETAARVAAGSFCRLLLMHFGIRIASHVMAVGEVSLPGGLENISMEAILAILPESPLRCAHAETEKAMVARVEKAGKEGDSLGGVAEIVASPVPPGLGSHIQWDLKLDGRLAQALMSIQAVKAVEIGNGVTASASLGSLVHDEIGYDADSRRFVRQTNNAGGLEGGISNGEELRVRIYVKPIPTLRKSLKSADLVSKKESAAAFERSDVCVVPAAGVVGEAMVAFVLAQAFLEKLGGDSIVELESNFANYEKKLQAF
jgi:chorismate synthase